jgi:hypothetical protein
LLEHAIKPFFDNLQTHHCASATYNLPQKSQKVKHKNGNIFLKNAENPTFTLLPFSAYFIAGGM